ncbi:MAG: DUF512 domain-containing protein [Clostridia bacterium]|nr:DUF512 domain-containing protein [Clostridia bacterium]
MKRIITRVEANSVAERHGLLPGDGLLSIDGEALLDEIDYQALTFPGCITLAVRRADGREERVTLRKHEGEPLGLRLDESMALSPRICRNQCLFCFVDQLPAGLRPSLYIKDDDWRYSLMMGNYVSLTNVDEAEFERMIKRRASPLYISVHATDPALRRRIMNNRSAGELMNKLQRLKNAGLRFHCQVVVCPGYNDGDALLQTLRDLQGLAPSAASVALVPVGLTKWRQGLEELRPLDGEGARKLLKDIAPLQEACRETLGTTFVFPSDEIFCLAGADIPPEEWYEHYPQIENGVGLLRQIESEITEAEQGQKRSSVSSEAIALVTGVSAAPHIARLAERFAPAGARVQVLPIVNHFFGETVTVAGLVTGGDILAQLPEELAADRLLIPACMLRHEGDCFLDNMTLAAFQNRCRLPVKVVDIGGQALYDALRGQ